MNSVTETRIPRSLLIKEWRVQQPYTRKDLADETRAGLRGIRISDPVQLTVDDPLPSLSFVKLLIDAAGVGLRVYWRTSELRVRTSLLLHLDPPVDHADRPLWPVPPTPLLIMRFGPSFVQIDDLRQAGVHRSVVDDDPYGTALRHLHTPTVPDSSVTEKTLDRLSKAGMVITLGDYSLALPVKFKYARD